MTLDAPDPLFPEWFRLPGEDDLPHSDGEPMETWRHVVQMTLLLLPLLRAWRDRDDFFVAGNMFVYFHPDQVQTRGFKGPDVFVAMTRAARARKSWVVWDEGKAPDVVIELISTTSARKDKVDNLRIYQDTLRAPESFWYDPWTAEVAGRLVCGRVPQPIALEAGGQLLSITTGLSLVRREGEFEGITARWLRWPCPTAPVCRPPTARPPTPCRRTTSGPEAELAQARQRIAELRRGWRNATRTGEGAST
ncbi:MAG: Uma2 family endonuclease [Dehalococcoidia bacterium]